MTGARMADFLFITHTAWSEAPRIRHQLARLLVEHGHTVHFFERSTPPFAPLDRTIRSAEPGISLVQSRRLLHHQLRLAEPLEFLNSAVVERSLREALREVPHDGGTTVVNFTHDYHFLRRIFPHNRIVTLIHDNFEAQARFGYAGHITRMLRRTVEMSDDVYAVSVPLCERLSRWKRAELLLPWAVVPYRAPHGDIARRNTIFYWGFVDTALDPDAILLASRRLEATRPGWKVALIGPTQSNRRETVTRPFAGQPNIEIRGQTALDELPLDESLAAFLPYRRSPSCDSVTLANKSLQLLARGMPLVINAMPHYLERPFIRRIDGVQPFDAVIDEVVARFAEWQEPIARFVAENSGESRLAQMKIASARADARR